MEQVWANTQAPGVERMEISKCWWLELDLWVERENSDLWNWVIYSKGKAFKESQWDSIS